LNHLPYGFAPLAPWELEGARAANERVMAKLALSRFRMDAKRPDALEVLEFAPDPTVAPVQPAVSF